MNMFEMTSLLVVSFSNSDRNLSIHKVAFGGFILSSLIYFYLHWYLYRFVRIKIWICRDLLTFYDFSYCLRPPMLPYQLKSLTWKKILIINYLLGILVKSRDVPFVDLNFSFFLLIFKTLN